MTLTIELGAEVARRLQEAVSRSGQETAEFVRAAVQEKLDRSEHISGDPDLANPLYAGLPRLGPEALRELAVQQGAPLEARFEELQGDFWPEDESTEEVLATLREWRREGRKPRKR